MCIRDRLRTVYLGRGDAVSTVYGMHTVFVIHWILGEVGENGKRELKRRLCGIHVLSAATFKVTDA